MDGEALAQLPDSEAGMAAGWVNTVRLGTEAIGVSLFGSLFASFAGDTTHASRQGFAVITIGTVVLAAAVGVASAFLRGRPRPRKDPARPAADTEVR
ncbi:hypothetical protein ACFZAR_21395 [Streptomyces sp. NPDC008222]|uniref:hypothetical protein n=1 Tax=Streptomyces sp. NPDC008222 TaxID=3364820 RepID=UPI0036E4C1D6